MKINEREISLKITPSALLKVEENSDFDYLKLYREAQDGVEPKFSEYCRLIYVGYLGGTGEDISFEDFMKLIEEIDALEISKIGVDLFIKRKN